ncbi:MAG TPA: response regulator [Candidatus Bilophila faecipullorum]|uniref:Response regulator n=1 Tax=Candidatus Bilophila faecipullorum TaxID=2838482 RepID=A0A9D1U878_9BACT|nr:response regulator [uncultured Bilophila sp.]HIW78329.1 response regulator [Candidatus Bilophila faecipullorum]
MDGRRVLVVDDEVHFRYFLKVLLEKAGYAVKTARNGLEALDMLAEWSPGLITLDVMMPEQSGLTFYGALCRDAGWKHIPVVMLSAVPVPVREHALAALGLTEGPLPPPAACLEKPCTPEALLEVVDRLFCESTLGPSVSKKEYPPCPRRF